MSPIARPGPLRTLIALLLLLFAGVAPVHAGTRGRGTLDPAASECCLAPAAACCPATASSARAARVVPTCCGVDAPASEREVAPAPPLCATGDPHSPCRERIAADASRSARCELASFRAPERAAPPAMDASPPRAAREAPASLLNRRAPRGSRVVLALLSIARI